MPEPVHLINPLHSLNGGSERHTLAMFDELSKWTDVHLWSEYKPDFEIAGQYPIRKIDPARGHWPKGGNLVFVGVYFGVGSWAREAHPRRTIVFFNTPDYERFPHFIQGLTEAGFTNVEVAYQAREFARQFPEYPGPVHPSFIDIEHFSPQARPAKEPFTVGRISRDNDDKHHHDDAELYRRLTDLGCHVRLQGAESRRELINDPRIEIHSEGARPAVEFMRSLDCFLYRIRAGWYEAWGRVVSEAMACGIPVVAENRGGYTEFVEQGRTGYLFNDNDEAVHQVMALKESEALRQEIGANAREAMVRINSDEARAEAMEFYYR